MTTQTPTPPELLVNMVAQAVFMAMRWAIKNPCKGEPPDWQNGNSLAEERARLEAGNIIAYLSARPQPSADAAIDTNPPVCKQAGAECMQTDALLVQARDALNAAEKCTPQHTYVPATGQRVKHAVRLQMENALAAINNHLQKRGGE